MSKNLKRLIICSVLLLPLLVFWLWTYFSLTNPFEEMYYSETNSYKVMNFNSLSKVIGSKSHFVAGEFDFLALDYNQNKGLLENEKIHIIVSDAHQLVFLYHQDIQQDVSVGVKFEYNFTHKSLTEEFSLTVGSKDNAKIYHGQEMLAKLKEYGKDKDWLKKQADTVLNDKILGLWFKEGSSRYSLKHLGDVKIIRDKVLE